MATAHDNAALLQEELEALAAIFADDCVVDADTRSATVWVPQKDADPRFRLCLSYPLDYPGASPPVVELSCAHLSEPEQMQIAQQLEDLFLPGEVVTFNMADLLRERIDRAVDALPSETSSAKQCASDDEECEVSPAAAPRDGTLDSHEAALVEQVAARITTGAPFTERKSTFQAHVAKVTSVGEVDAMITALKRNNKIARATHNMVAYRITVSGKGTMQDFDDDGESAAGSRMLHLLQMADVTDACVVVTRWFGGVHLGPSRFAIINNTARQLLVQEGFMQSGATRGKGKK